MEYKISWHEAEAALNEAKRTGSIEPFKMLFRAKAGERRSINLRLKEGHLKAIANAKDGYKNEIGKMEDGPVKKADVLEVAARYNCVRDQLERDINGWTKEFNKWS